MTETRPLILASGSLTRRRLLEGAGVPVTVRVSGVDEGPIKTALAGRPAEEVAMRLAEAKASAVGKDAPPDTVVIGADQILTCQGRQYDKAATREAAEEVLRSLRGRAHRLITAVVVVRGGDVRWRHVATALLIMRDFSDDFLTAYLDRIGEAALAGVGCYQLEGPGIQLFERIAGDYFAILGLPLVPLLGFLREEEIIPA